MCSEKTLATALNAGFAADAAGSSPWNVSWASRAAKWSVGRDHGWMFDFAITRINSAIEEEQQLQAQADENATACPLAPSP